MRLHLSDNSQQKEAENKQFLDKVEKKIRHLYYLLRFVSLIIEDKHIFRRSFLFLAMNRVALTLSNGLQH